jgi:hypothetical protein
MFRLKQRIFFILVSCWLTLSAGASANDTGWLVYELKFTPDAAGNLNFHFYTGAYIITPIVGGASSLVLTTEEGERLYVIADKAARAFTAAGPTTRKTVISAIALNGSAQASYLATGDINHTLSLPGPKGLRSFRVAGTLLGTLIASDDDSEARTLPQDGTLGMVGSAIIEGRLREDLTYNASQYTTQADAVLYLAGLLERYGYTAEGAQPITLEGEPAPPVVKGALADPVTEGADAALVPAGSAVDITSDR